jgi:CheY-like chemotaxis protein
MADTRVGVAYIDPNVQYVGVSKLRTLNASSLEGSTFVVQENNQPIAVIVSFTQYLEMQKERDKVRATLEMLVNDNERNALLAGMQDVLSKKIKPISVVRETIRKKKRQR